MIYIYAYFNEALPTFFGGHDVIELINQFAAFVASF